MEFVLATTNAHKLAEIRKMMPDGFKISSLTDVNFNEEIIEDGVSFEENALIKARAVHRYTGMNCFADDSGLEVDALNGEPGIYSARYAGPAAEDPDNLRLVLDRMAGKKDRKARFVAAIALIINGEEHTFNGVIEGSLALEPLGSNGFGYDPAFIPEGYEQTFGQLSATIKQELSHRAKAVNEMIRFLLKR
jgi:XTP/dITP diphosphohydrolase